MCESIQDTFQAALVHPQLQRSELAWMFINSVGRDPKNIRLLWPMLPSDVRGIVKQQVFSATTDVNEWEQLELVSLNGFDSDAFTAAWKAGISNLRSFRNEWANQSWRVECSS